jgi:O-antigen ligase
LSRRFESAAVVSVLTVSTGGFFALTRGTPTDDPSQGGGPARWFWIATFAVLVLVVAPRIGDRIGVLIASWPVVAVAALGVVSTLWSATPKATLQASVSLFLTTILGIVLAERYGYARFMSLLTVALGITLTVSAALAVLDPGLGLDHTRSNSWRGVFLTKNELGRIAVVALLVACLHVASSRRFRFPASALAGLSLVCVWESGSRTALFAVGALAIAALLGVFLRANYVVRTAAVCFAVLALVALVVFLLPTLNAEVTQSGTNVTLTGRTGIWRAVIASIRQRPWLGYGYDGFWHGLAGPSASVWSQVGPVVHAHNGFLETWLEFGAVGLALAVLALGWGILLAYRHARDTRTAASLFPFLGFAFLIAYNFTESSLVSRDSLFWILVAVLFQSVRRRPLGLARDPVPIADGGRFPLFMETR